MTIETTTTHPTIERAVETFEAAKRKLYRTDGQPLYAEAEMRDRIDVLLAQYDATVAPVVERLDEEAKQLQREIRLSQREPWEKLTPADLEKAAARRAFIAEDAEHHTLEDLADRLQLELEAGDKVGKILWHRFARIRLGAEQAKGTPGRDLTELVNAIRSFEAEFADSTSKAKEEASRLKSREAARVGVDAMMVRRRLDGTEERERRRMAARYQL